MHQGSLVNLPAITGATTKPDVLRNDALQIAVTRTGDFFVSGQVSRPSEKIKAPDIPNQLVSLEHPGVERRVYVHADGRAKYGDVATALDAIRYAGLSNVTFMVEKWRATPPPPAPAPEP